VVLSNAAGATITSGQGTATGTITNDDVSTTLTITNVSAAESSGTINFNHQPERGPADCHHVHGNDGKWNGGSGQGFRGEDPKLHHRPGTTTATFSVAITDDALFERDETMSANITKHRRRCKSERVCAQGTINR
jgi:hypothetical protein